MYFVIESYAMTKTPSLHDSNLNLLYYSHEHCHNKRSVESFCFAYYVSSRPSTSRCVCLCVCMNAKTHKTEYIDVSTCMMRTHLQCKFLVCWLLLVGFWYFYANSGRVAIIIRTHIHTLTYTDADILYAWLQHTHSYTTLVHMVCVDQRQQQQQQRCGKHGHNRNGP